MNNAVSTLALEQTETNGKDHERQLGDVLPYPLPLTCVTWVGSTTHAKVVIDKLTIQRVVPINSDESSYDNSLKYYELLIHKAEVWACVLNRILGGLNLDPRCILTKARAWMMNLK